ncbi:MAG: DUF6531 domain-containing protein [Verrucomicrobia bacterium]|nr:DUF6531 domain-containing protein [Verrucomicrobiota bacterium]
MRNRPQYPSARIPLYAALLLCILYAPSLRGEASCWNDSRLRQTPGGGGDTDDPTGKGPKGDPGEGEGGEEGEGGDGGDDPATTEDDINLTNGNFDFVERDLYIPSNERLKITRTYNSQDLYDGPFGWGWSHTFDQCIVPRVAWNIVEDIFVFMAPSGPVPQLSLAIDPGIIVRRSNGSLTRFTPNPASYWRYAPPPGCHDELTILLKWDLWADVMVNLSSKRGEVWYFNWSSGRPTAMSLKNQFVFLENDTTGRLDKVQESRTGRELVFTYGANNKITQILDPANRILRYAYDSANNLVGFTDPLGNTTSYTYDDKHRLLTVTTPNGAQWLSNTYDSKSRVVSQTYAGGTKTISYGGTADTPTARVTDRNGHVTDYTMTAKGLPTRIEWERYPGTDVRVLEAVCKTYDADHNRTSETDPLGRTTRYEYDGMGNLLKVIPPTDEAGNPDKFATRSTYTANFNQISSITDAKGQVTRFEYDGIGRLTRTIPPSDNPAQPHKFATTYSYPGTFFWGPRDMTSSVDALGNTTTYEYDRFGYVSRIQYPAVNGQVAERTMVYDTIGNLLRSTDPNGNTTLFTYDLGKHVTSITDALGNVTRFSYNSIGKRTSITNALGKVTSYGYDNYGKLLTVTDPLDNTTTYTYDAEGNRLTTTDPEDNVTTNTYNQFDRLASTADAMGHKTGYLYNGDLLFRIGDAKNNYTHYYYDARKRLERTKYPDDSYEQFTYDAVGNLASKRTRSGDTVQYTYDELNRLTRKTYPDTTEVANEYDVLGRLTRATNVNGILEYAYDTRGRVTGSVQNGKTVGYEYDAAGNRSKLIYPDATFITYTYDELNRLQRIRDGDGADVAVFSYDALGRRSQLDLANGTRAAYAYDNANRLLNLANTKVSDNSVLSSFGYNYDRSGNRRTMTTPQGTHGYAYDKTYQLTAVDYPDGSPFPDTTYTYDALGNRTTVVTTNGTESYEVNNLNQYKSVGSQNYTYDGNGNLTSDGAKTLVYNLDNQLVAATNAGIASTYEFDAVGRRIKKNVDGTALGFVYDGDRIIGEYDGDGAELRRYVNGAGIDERLVLESGGNRQYFHFDALASVRNLSDSSGASVAGYEYDVFGTPSPTPALGSSVALFTGREFDGETGMYHYRARSYSPGAARFTQSDPVGMMGGVNLYAYCGNSSVSFRDPYGLSKEGGDDPGEDPLHDLAMDLLDMADMGDLADFWDQGT